MQDETVNEATTYSPPPSNKELVRLLLASLPRALGYGLLSFAVVFLLAYFLAPDWPTEIKKQSVMRRGSLARVKADLRSFATALEAYKVDEGVFLPARNTLDSYLFL